jgi:hypothetical protein
VAAAIAVVLFGFLSSLASASQFRNRWTNSIHESGLLRNRSLCARASFMLATFVALTALVPPVDPRYRWPKSTR